jgi:DNA-binding transcriptional ArsR family regulator
MSSPFEELAALDRVVHDPARLAILTALAACRSADFTFLLRLTGLTNGNLSSHLARLEEAGLVQLERRFVGKRPNTLIQLTGRGKATVNRHWKLLDSLRKSTRDWSPDSE